MILGFLGKFLGGPKTKVFLGIIFAMSVAGSLLYWRYNSVKESLILANKEIQDVAQELRRSENTIEELERDIKLQSRLLSEKEEQRRETQQLATSLTAQLEKEKGTNEQLQECLPISLSDYADRVREFDAYTPNSDRNNSDQPE